MRGRYQALAVLALGAGLGGGVALERYHLSAPSAGRGDGPEILYWVAPMDPNYRRDAPGKSPMGMDLIPVYEGGEPAGDPAEVMLSAAEINAIGVRTAVARREEIAQEIRTVGFADWDEHRTAHVHTRVEGWIERLEVRAIGDRVQAGDLLFELFSPEAGAAAAELVRAIEDRPGGRIAEIAKNRLRSIGFSEAQITEISETRQTPRNIRILAPQDGVVVALEAAEGMYLKPDIRAMTLTDPGQIWLIAEVFERDLGRLTPDMRAGIRFDSLPGEVFEGRIDYIYPELDTVTRTLPVRLVLGTAGGKLRPGMFGAVRLLPAAAQEAVTVPSEALIRTGRAERVILKTGEGSFRPRLVATGLRDSFGAGGRTEIVQGLAPGEEVVASAQFLIDSESVLNAGMMRMAPTEEAPARGRGGIVKVDAAARRVTIRHGAIEALDWPAMETVFAAAAGLRLDRLVPGEAVAFTLVRGADGLLALSRIGRDDGVAATGHGTAQAVTAEGRLSLSHDPIPDLGWPAMTMDMELKGVDAASVPLGVPVDFDLAENDAGMYAIVAVRPAGERAGAPAPAPAGAPSRRIETTGTVNSVDAAARVANVTHGPMTQIGMPGMTMDFPLAEGVDPEGLPLGQETGLSFVQDAGMSLRLAAVAPPVRIIEATGTVNSVDAAARVANVTHGPMTQIGMPGMTMDFPLAEGVDPEALPVGQEMPLRFAQGADMSLRLTAGDAP
ncbi:efflux RND transporter periplasmic adaptor subunit [Poseidonocella sp. HB161398]|uniref:efflux RND transporter periplasmic adaptor subunit n=1 Tax=Poseidonocella sp. HB161398 TaxID=2320855 RepID=UPI001108C086|nr:efflux RND transporter periplasmic adaptor subunit [Poseidonocella sp. HB161398]